MKAILWHVKFELDTEISHLATVYCTYYLYQFISLVNSHAHILIIKPTRTINFSNLFLE
jgi:hypothetical protein